MLKQCELGHLPKWLLNPCPHTFAIILAILSNLLSIPEIFISLSLAVICPSLRKSNLSHQVPRLFTRLISLVLFYIGFLLISNSASSWHFSYTKHTQMICNPIHLPWEQPITLLKLVLPFDQESILLLYISCI